jgi:FkbM family methyltransferase
LADSGGGMLTQLVLRWAPRLSRFRQIPVLGEFLHWASTKTVPRDSLVWVQVSKGLAAGLWLAVNPRTGAHILEGSTELPVQKALQEHLRPGMVFYDLGANIGFFSLLGARLVGETGRVFSFEADPELATRLRANIARNHFGWLSVEEKAVWSETGTVAFRRADTTQSPDRGLGFVTKTPNPSALEVEAVSLDDFALSFSPPDFIKCDVEGAEVEVMRGAQQLLQTKRPAILVELHSDENRRTLLEEFSRAGYRCQPCDENHVLALPQ